MSTDYLKIKKQYSDQLYHHGIPDQRWGIRRYQNPDGSLTEEGRLRYNKGRSKEGLPDDWKDKVKDKDDPATVRISVDDRKKYYFSGPSIDKKTGKPKRDKDGNLVYDKKDGVLIKEHENDLTDKELKDLANRVKSENSLAAERSKEAARPYNNAKDVLGDSARLLEATSNALPTGNGKVIRKDYSNLSDQELRNRINRLSLEESYGKLSGDTKYVKSGSEKTREYLQTAGAILGIAGSAAALAATIMSFKYRNPGTPKVKQSDLTDDNDINSLQHFGILGMKWGIRRYQDANGSLTAAGKQRYRTNQGTKEVLRNTSSYDSLTRREQRKYIKSKTISSERRSMIAGAAIGASLGIGKSIFNIVMRKKSGKKIKGEEMSKIEAGFVGRTVLGGLIGAKIGQLVGKNAGKASAEASMAERGQKYTKQLLNVPIERLENEKRKP